MRKRMWRGGTALLAGLLAAGCIPQVAPPDDYPPGPAASRDYPPVRRAPPPDRDLPPPEEPVPQDRPVREVQVPVSTLPSARPAWEARPVSPDAETIEESDYTVRSGDSLFVIAQRTRAGADAIALANGLTAPFQVNAGQRLRIPAGRYHLIRSGESGIAIARAYGVEWSRIVAANGLTEPYVLRAGQRVLIPEAAAGSSRAAERAAAFQLDIDDILTGGEPALAANQAPAKPVSKPTRVLSPSAVVAAPKQLASGFAWPVEGSIASRFGPGESGIRNNGIGIAVPIGTPVHATADGVVAYAGTGIAALGGLVIVKHGSNWASVYGYASKLLVTRGQSVKQGQTIALSGETGFAERPELHFELRKGRTPVDPRTQLPAR